MAVIFDEITGNVRANEPAEPAPSQPEAAIPAPALTAVMLKRALSVLQQRQARLRAS